MMVTVVLYVHQRAAFFFLQSGLGVPEQSQAKPVFFIRLSFFEPLVLMLPLTNGCKAGCTLHYRLVEDKHFGADIVGS